MHQPSPGIIHSDSTAQVAQIQSYYKLHARMYDLTRWSFLFGRKKLIYSLPFDEKAAITIMEVGCGTGFNLELLAKRFPNAKLIGVDVSSDMLQKAASRNAAFKDRINFINEPYGKDSQFLREQADAIICSYSLSMINPQWEEVILQAKKDLKPGGYIGAADFHRSQFGWFERHMGNNHVRMDGHLLDFFQKHFGTHFKQESQAYLGVWEYMVYVGQKDMI